MTTFDTHGIQAIKEAFALAKTTFQRPLTEKEEGVLAKAIVERAEAGHFVGRRIATLALKDILGRLAVRKIGDAKQRGTS